MKVLTKKIFKFIYQLMQHPKKVEELKVNTCKDRLIIYMFFILSYFQNPFFYLFRKKVGFGCGDNRR